MLVQNFGVINKEHYDMLWYFLEWSIKRVRAQRNREEIRDYGGKREKKGVISKKQGAEAGNARFWRRNV